MQTQGRKQSFQTLSRPGGSGKRLSDPPGLERIGTMRFMCVNEPGLQCPGFLKCKAYAGWAAKDSLYVTVTDQTPAVQ